MQYTIPLHNAHACINWVKALKIEGKEGKGQFAGWKCVIKEQLRQRDFQQSRPSPYLLIYLYLFIIIHLFIHSFIPIFKVPLETRWLGMTVSLSQPRIEIMATATRTIALFSTTEHGGTSIPPCDQTSMDGTIHKKPQRQMPLSGRSGEA